MQVRVGNRRPWPNYPPDQSGNTLCYSAASIPAGTTSVACTVPSTGMFVSIQLMNLDMTLSLCEVAVTGAASGGALPDQSCSQQGHSVLIMCRCLHTARVACSSALHDQAHA